MGWFDWLFGRPKYGGESHKAASIRSVPRHTTEGAEFGDVAGAHIRADQKSAGRNQRITENVLSGVDNNTHSTAANNTFITLNGYQPNDRSRSEQQRGGQTPLEDAGPSNPATSFDAWQVTESIGNEIRKRHTEIIEDLRKELKKHRSENQRLADELRLSKDEVERLKDELKSSKNTSEDLERKLRESKDELGGAKRRNRELANELKEWKESIESDGLERLSHLHRVLSRSATPGVVDPTEPFFDTVLRSLFKPNVWDKDFNLSSRR